MRSRDIVKNLEDIYDSFSVKSGNDGGYMIIYNHLPLMEKLQKLEKLGLCINEINEFKDMSLYNKVMPTVTLLHDVYTKYNALIVAANNKLSGIIESAALFQNEVKDYSIAIKTPPLNRLKDLAEFTEELDKCISLAISDDNLRTDYTISSFDKGSMWYEICLNAKETFLVFGSVVLSAFYIQKNKLEIEEYKKRISALNTNAEAIKTIKLALDSDVNALIELNAKNIIEKHNISGEDIEYKNRLIKSIRQLSELIHQGCEVHKLSDHNNEKDNVDDFPDFSKPELLQAKIKQLLLMENNDIEK